MSCSGRRFQASDLAQYHQARLAWELTQDRLCFLRSFFTKWASAWSAARRARQKQLSNNALVLKFRNRVAHGAFRAWKELAGQMGRVKRFLRFHMANSSQGCWDKWRNFVREQQKARLKAIEGFVYRMRNRTVVNCFGNLKINVQQNVIMRRFLKQMTQRAMVLTFDAWAWITERSRTVRLWQISKWWKVLRDNWAAERDRKEAIVQRFVVRMTHACLLRCFARVVRYRFLGHQARKIESVARGHFDRCIYRAMQDEERQAEGLRRSDEELYRQVFISEARRLVRAFLMDPTGVSAVNKAAKKLRKSERNQRPTTNGSSANGGMGSDLMDEGAVENARGVFELFAAAEPLRGRQEGMIGIDRDKLQALLEAALQTRVHGHALDKALGLVVHGTEWRAQKGAITLREFVRICGYFASQGSTFARMRRRLCKRHNYSGEESRVRRTIQGTVEAQVGRKASHLFRLARPCAVACSKCYTPFRFIADRNFHSKG